MVACSTPATPRDDEDRASFPVSMVESASVPDAIASGRPSGTAEVLVSRLIVRTVREVSIFFCSLEGVWWAGFRSNDLFSRNLKVLQKFERSFPHLSHTLVSSCMGPFPQNGQSTDSVETTPLLQNRLITGLRALKLFPTTGPHQFARCIRSTLSPLSWRKQATWSGC